MVFGRSPPAAHQSSNLVENATDESIIIERAWSTHTAAKRDARATAQDADTRTTYGTMPEMDEATVGVA